MNHNDKILGRRMYSLRLKVEAWQEDSRLILISFTTFICEFGWLDAVPGKMYERSKINLSSSSPATFFKFVE